MSLLGMQEIAVLSCDLQQQRVCGVRLRQRGRNACELVNSCSCEQSDWVQAANEVLKKLSVNSSVYLILSMNLESSEVFECTLPEASLEIMREALRFEVPRQLISVPENFQLQYTFDHSADESGMLHVCCAVVPVESLHKLYGQLSRLRRKADAIVHPVLALPEELRNAPVQLSGFEPGYCWYKGAWQLADAAEMEKYNPVCNEYIRKTCGNIAQYSEDGQSAQNNDVLFRTAYLGGVFAVQRILGSNRQLSALNLLPDYLRPARYRAQLRVMALLLVLLVTVNVCRYAGSFFTEYRSSRRQTAELTNLRSKVQELRRSVKAGEKELKEIQRVAELKLGSRECLGYLGYLSEKLPDDVLLSNFRWNEGTVDLNLQTTSPELDLVSFFNRLPGFKVISASQRSNPNNSLTVASVKLSVIETVPEFAAGIKDKRKSSK